MNQHQTYQKYLQVIKRQSEDTNCGNHVLSDIQKMIIPVVHARSLCLTEAVCSVDCKMHSVVVVQSHQILL